MAWAQDANEVFFDLKIDIARVRDKLTRLRNIINTADDVKELNPFLTLIEGTDENLEQFVDQFETQ
jgi:hypothetical protein